MAELTLIKAPGMYRCTVCLKPLEGTRGVCLDGKAMHPRCTWRALKETERG